MRAIGYRTPLSIDNEESLVDLELPVPEATGHDLLVEVKAVSVNPVDTKVRAGAVPEPGHHRILGFDAAGVVKAVGEKVTLFKPGDPVYYAGAIDRPGTNSEFHLVDERIVGRKPESLGFAEAAALPLTAITAYEMLFHRLKVQDKPAPENNILLVTGGAGGVGSMTIQLARVLTDLTVVTTASRPESTEWARALGAHHVLDHRNPLAPQYAGLGLDAPYFVFSVTRSDLHTPGLIAIIAPQGRFGIIDDIKDGFDAMPFKGKSLSIHWEMMFARSLYHTPDMIEQHRLLNHVTDLVDAGRIRTTLAETLGTINAANLRRAHALVESGHVTGKVVLEGFDA